MARADGLWLHRRGACWRVKKVLLAVAFPAALLGGAYFLFSAASAAATNAFGVLSSPSVWLFVASASLLFASTYLPSALIWRRLLLWQGIRVSASEALALLLRTTPAKYLPGNVAQPMSRAAGLALRGWPLPAAVTSLFEEATLSLGVALLLGLSTAVLLLSSFPEPLAAFLPWFLFVSVFVILAFLFFLMRDTAPRRWISRASSLIQPSRAFAVCVGYAFVMILIGCSISIASFSVVGVDLRGGAVVFSAFLLAWALGSLVPGAPAGLGVRDGALVWMLTPHFAEGAVVIAAVARLATVFGDVVAFIGGLLFFGRPKAWGL
ncbi:lysylphosphatidylglycerol synthase domain-containing protein [Silanimonas sp.]|jgi:hypothetical protein|uniref:lysylphosphatidylglycerol synthase domain-containing protein n=1 Tax=Silanimonas sp. TaxID=1929290 RepID=UPI0022CAC15C|nr:lysylphosphatidylglycerol synthase domain-containing protein [Silanimonas sp.]MCZ8062368.1 lysylphosphatidylglycerol synthase domain-containing protein [Silanimonas sp.]